MDGVLDAEESSGDGESLAKTKMCQGEAAISKKDFRQLFPENLMELENPANIKKVPLEWLKYLTPKQLQYLSAKQRRALLAEQIDAEYVYNSVDSKLTELMGRSAESIASEAKTLCREKMASLGAINREENRKEILLFLAAIGKHALNNVASKSEIKRLRQAVFHLCTAPLVAGSSVNELADEFGGDYPSSNFLKQNNPSCVEIALEAEATLIMLDAKRDGHIGLAVTPLARGDYNTVYASADGALALKLCDKFNPRFSERIKFQTAVGKVVGAYRCNLATDAVQRLMEQAGAPHVVANVAAGVMKNGRACVATEMIGEELEVFGILHSENSKLVKEFIERDTWIQLEDILTGQVDRHDSNVNISSAGWPVGIDHDLCFPTMARVQLFKDSPAWGFRNNTCPAEIKPNVANTIPDTLVAVSGEGVEVKSKGQGSIGVDGGVRKNFCMPPVIDVGMRDAILGINLDELGSIYGDCGLTRAEIEPALKRAELLKARIRNMATNRVVKPEQWSAALIGAKGCTSVNFYAHRHSECVLMKNSLGYEWSGVAS